MNKKSKTQFLLIIVIILLFLFIPEDVVWGGSSFQTVPTVGPSRTPTTAITATQAVATNTQMVNTQPVSANPTSTNTQQVIIQPTSTPTQDPTEISATTTKSVRSTAESTQPGPILGSDDEATTSISLPLVSTGDGEGQQQETDRTQPEVITTLPAFVLPLLAVLVLVIFYLIFRLITKKSSEMK